MHGRTTALQGSSGGYELQLECPSVNEVTDEQPRYQIQLV
jgi:hypothetical protein